MIRLLGIVFWRLPVAVVVEFTDDLLVLARLKWRPPSGPARWR